MVGDRRGPGGGRIVVLAALAAVVAACGSGTPPGETPCPPGAATGTVTVAQVLASMAEAVECPTNPVYPTDSCYAGTAWSVGPNLFLTAGHGVHSGALGPPSKSPSRPYIQVTQGNPVFSGGRIVTNAKIVAYDVTNSDIALIQTTDLSLPALPISTKNVVAGLTGTDVCDLNTIDNIVPPPTVNVFTGTTGAVHPTGLGANGGPTTEFDLTQPSSGPGSPEGCSGSPVLVAGQVAGAVFAGTRQWHLGRGRCQCRSGASTTAGTPSRFTRRGLRRQPARSAPQFHAAPSHKRSALRIRGIQRCDLPVVDNVSCRRDCRWARRRHPIDQQRGKLVDNGRRQCDLTRSDFLWQPSNLFRRWHHRHKTAGYVCHAERRTELD
jgi:hypothetical protein